MNIIFIISGRDAVLQNCPCVAYNRIHKKHNSCIAKFVYPYD